MNVGRVTGAVGNFLTDAASATSYGIYKGTGKLGKQVSLNTAQKLGVGIIGGATIGGTIGTVTNIDEGIAPTAGGLVGGAGLGATSGASIGAIAAAIARGR